MAVMSSTREAAIGAVCRDDVLRFRVHAQQLDATTSSRRDAAVLDLERVATTMREIASSPVAGGGSAD
jgi:hypothetical protein